MPTRKKGKGRQPHRKSKPTGPLSDCKLPHDVILNILSRLPVRSLLRFRSVCKPWKSLIRSPKFLALHLSRSSSAAATTSPSLLLHSIHKTTLDNNLSLFSLRPPSLTSRVGVDNSYPSMFLEMDLVGSHNGIVCVCQPPWGDSICIFNPATKRWKKICWHKCSKPVPTHQESISVGFGFDSLTNCYKVICILNFKEEIKVQVAVTVYSSTKDAWERIEIRGPRFYFRRTTCDVVVKGVPYWLAVIEDKYGKLDVLAWFDMHNNVFHHIPMLAVDSRSIARLADWKGDMAVLVYPKSEEMSTFIDVWMLDDDENGVEWWSKKFSVGPILGMKCLVGCSRNGQIVGEDGQGNLFMYDSEAGVVEKFGVDGKFEHKFAVCNYMESLVSFKAELPPAEIRTEECLGKLKASIDKLNKRAGSIAPKIRRESNGNCVVLMPFEDGSIEFLDIPYS